MRQNLLLLMIICLVFAVIACSSSPNDSTTSKGNDGTQDIYPALSGWKFEPLRQELLSTINRHTELHSDQPQQPETYQAVADMLAAVDGVESAHYGGDTLGTISIKVKGGGSFIYRHIENDFEELDTLPEEADFSRLLHPVWNADWTEAVDVTETDIEAMGTNAANAKDNNFHATRFPLASGDPDPDFQADDDVELPQEGKIAIVDFVWSDGHENYAGLYYNQFVADGVEMYDRIKWMGEAAGFKVDLFKDDEINATNFNKLEDYTIVIIIAHGGIWRDENVPSYTSSGIEEMNYSYICTPECYPYENEEKKLPYDDLTYAEAWYYNFFQLDLKRADIMWTPLFFRELYRPSVPQLWMVNSCRGFQPETTGFNKLGDGKKQRDWKWMNEGGEPIYNIGEGLMDAGVNVAFGYAGPVTPEAILENTISFFRRHFGGNSNSDKPFNLLFWPTCMSAQSYFRRPESPEKPVYANRVREGSVWTMYAVEEPQYFREVCEPNPNAHFSLQQEMLLFGTPAPALTICWDEYWSKNEYPNGLANPICSKGDNPAGAESTVDAACAIRVARKVTNALLKGYDEFDTENY